MVTKLLFRFGIILILILTSVIFFTGSVSSRSVSSDSINSSSVNSPSNSLMEQDLDGDGLEEEYRLENHILTVKEDGQVLWISPEDYSIDSFVLGDVDNDKEMNLVVSLWKTGSFGEMKPFWLTGEDLEYKNHLFVYRLQENQLEQVWCSSNLDRPTLSFSIEDINEDGLNEMVVEEGAYKQISPERFAVDSMAPSQTTLWMWNEWGFELFQ